MDIGYARVSTYEQNLELQLDALRRAGCDVIREERASGAAGVDRPVQEAVLHELMAGDRLTVWKLDRLGRSAMDLQELVTDLDERGVQFRALTQAIDTSNSLGWFFFQLLAAFAELERAMIVERTKAGKAARVAQGLHPGGARAYGLTADRQTVIEEEAARLREAATYALDGGSLAAKVDAWNKAGVPTLSGTGGWRVTTLRRMLVNPNLVPAVFDANTHDALVRLFAPARSRQRFGGPAKHLGSGILKCECGAPMYTYTDRDRRGVKVFRYRCQSKTDGRPAGCGRVSISTDVADKWLTEAVVAAVVNERFTNALNARQAVLLAGEATSEQLDEWQRTVDDLEKVLSTQFATDEHRALYDDIKRRLKNARARLLARPELQELLSLPRAEAAFREAWRSWDIAQRRRKLRLLLHGVTVKAVGRGARFDVNRLVPDWKDIALSPTASAR